MPMLELGDARIHYCFDGPADAPVLVLSNSLGTDLEMWAPQMPAFTKAFRVLRYDTRGHGRSPATPGPYTVAQLGQDVVSLLDGLGIERAHFCGLSMGGMIGMWLGVNAGLRLKRLVLCNTAAKIGTADLWNARIDRVNAAGMAAIADAVVERWFTPGFVERQPAAVALLRQMLVDSSPDGYGACCAAVRDMDQRADIAHITVPTLVITGTHDGATPAADGRAAAEAIPGARYVELDASHLSNVEQAEQFTGHVLGFLTE
jgi:3-oxoadipate enol-lactonase